MSLWGVTAVSSMESLLGDCSSTYCKRASAPGLLILLLMKSIQP